MMKNIAKALVGAVAGLMFCATTYAQDLPKTNLKVIGPQSRGVSWHLIVKPFWDEKLPELSNNQIQPDLVSMTELGLKGPEIFRLVKMGMADLGVMVMGYASGEVPELDGFDLAGAIQDVDTLKKAADSYAPIVNDVMQKRVGVRVLGYFPLGQQGLWCATPIGGIKDLQGKKIRVFATTQADFVKSVGGTPVTMPATEVPASLQRKVIDCAVTGLLSGNIGKWPEVATHLYPINLGWAMMTVFANEKSWARMDPKVKEFLVDKIQNVMITGAWDVAREGDQQGIWCSTGDGRCSWGQEHNVTRFDMELVPYSEADDVVRKEMMEQTALPEFAGRCGAECAAAWNETVGQVLGMTAKAK